MTLETQGVRQQVTDSLVNNRKQLLAASYQAIAMNEAKIENFLAKKVVDNPNELSGARPAGASTPPSTDTNANTTANANTATNTKPVANTPVNTKTAPAKPAANNTAKPAGNK